MENFINSTKDKRKIVPFVLWRIHNYVSEGSDDSDSEENLALCKNDMFQDIEETSARDMEENRTVFKDDSARDSNSNSDSDSDSEESDISNEGYIMNMTYSYNDDVERENMPNTENLLSPEDFRESTTESTDHVKENYSCSKNGNSATDMLNFRVNKNNRQDGEEHVSGDIYDFQENVNDSKFIGESYSKYRLRESKQVNNNNTFSEEMIENVIEEVDSDEEYKPATLKTK